MQCNHCSNTIRSCYMQQHCPEEYSWCLQAQGWHKKKNKWRCPICHHQPMNCRSDDLGHVCLQNAHGILQHPSEMAQLHGFIATHLDVHVANLVEFGFEYVWHHRECGGNFPAFSPTHWCFGSDCSRMFSRLDMWRPCPDWTNRRWCEVALNMPTSCLPLIENRARHSTLASWVECLVGLITAIGTSACFLPEGNILEIANVRSQADGVAFMETVWQIWTDLRHIGVPMPTDDFTRSPFCGLRQMLDQ